MSVSYTHLDVYKRQVRAGRRAHFHIPQHLELAYEAYRTKKTCNWVFRKSHTALQSKPCLGDSPSLPFIINKIKPHNSEPLQALFMIKII